MNNQKGVINIILVVAIFSALLIAGTYFFVTQKIIPSSHYFIVNPIPNPNLKACTQDAKQCPDGSYVSRTGQNCEFTQCPVANLAPNEEKIFLKEGQRESSLLLEKIYPTYITGLNFREYPLAVDKGEPITLNIGETASNGCTITLTLANIEINTKSTEKTAVFIKKIDTSKPCPICLAENTLIDTPNGAIAVQQLKTGMTIWTVDTLGNKISAIIVKTSKTPVPTGHQMVHVVLADKRELLVSPGHPIGDGRFFDNLSVGNMLDGSHVVSVEKIPYDKGYTYDILPSGKTGLYFANGTLIDSTLH